VKLYHKAKLQAFVPMWMIYNHPKTFQNKTFRVLNDVTLVELSSKLIRQTLMSTVSTCLLRVESVYRPCLQ